MIKRTRTVTGVGALGIAAALVLTGCSSSGSSGSSGSGSSSSLKGTVTVGYSGGGVVDTYMSDIIKHAEKELPGVTIKTHVYPTYDDQLNQLPTQFAAGTAPDITLWDNSAPVAEYATEGAIASMDDVIGKTDVQLSAFPKALVNGWKIGGKLYAVPSYLQNSGYAYNQDVLAEAGVTSTPKTLAEIATAAAQVKAKTGKPGVVLLENLFHLTQYMIANGGGYHGGTTIDSKQNVQALDQLLTMFKNGDAESAEQLGATWDGEAFGKGNAAMSDAGPWYIGFMQTSDPSTKYTLTTLPGKTASSSTVATYGGGFSIAQKSKDKAVDMAVIAAMTDSYSQKAIITTKLGYVPAATKYISQYRQDTPQYAAFTNSVLAKGESLDYPTKSTEFGNDLVNGFQQLVAKKATSSTALLHQLQQKYGK
ncbi:hypothetical protein DEI81_11650 [Curtobacterium sp. MCBD17_013]|uniref:ABC transporter substrate-binding protein n=1 Tax=Curtobacterium sp. MCBD17_013 TaxID=2175668 RepID=UPI000DA6FA44|nr:extracellular solute-binding protein [Curtobacterium sp. MCBD17_013]PZF61427.1 hypothetical protein DEI81_11650 [Curtobacterium sp. MCBD17_013]